MAESPVDAHSCAPNCSLTHAARLNAGNCIIARDTRDREPFTRRHVRASTREPHFKLQRAHTSLHSHRETPVRGHKAQEEPPVIGTHARARAESSVLRGNLLAASGKGGTPIRCRNDRLWSLNSRVNSPGREIIAVSPFQMRTAAPANCPPITLRDSKIASIGRLGGGGERKKGEREKRKQGKGQERGEKRKRFARRDVIAGGLFAGE